MHKKQRGDGTRTADQTGTLYHITACGTMKQRVGGVG